MLTNGYLILPQSLILVWLIAILLYRHFYNRNINMILNGAKGSKLMSPGKFAVITVIAVLVIYNVISLIRLADTKREKLYDASDFFSISYSADTMEELDETAYQGLYSHLENAAYTKTEYTQNDFQYTVFTSQLFSDGMHPDTIVYIEYIGKQIDPYTMYATCRFYDPEGNPLSSFMKGNNPDPCFMFMLRYGENCKAEIILDYVKNEEDAKRVNDGDLKNKNGLLEEIAMIHESFTLELRQHQ